MCIRDSAPVALFNGDAHSDEERNAYTAAKVAANREVFGPSNYDITWEESFRKVVNADNAVQADIKQKADDVQARKDQADRTDALIKAVQDLANKSADNNGDNKGGDNGSDDATKPGNNKDDKSSNIKDKLSNDGKPTPLAIFGIVAGVLAAIAAAFPAIAKALNIKLPF